ncbi:regulator of volume decrease after cellular swelling-domain-containing protein [Zopfochytrium polystomum]|nr:regulator of volume decrease after cellular swelling-domain-containing protein [Zopfochytrium polystomum]
MTVTIWCGPSAEEPNALAEEEVVRHTQPSCSILFTPLIGPSSPGKGTLYITESMLLESSSAPLLCLHNHSRVRFESSTTQRSYSIDYPSIVIHAISRAGSDPVASQGCIYCQLDGPSVLIDVGASEPSNSESLAPPQANVNESESGAEEDEDGEPTYEMRIVPDDADSLHSIFLALSDCAALHPDKDADMEETEDDGWICADDDVGELDEVRQAALDHLSTVFESARIPNPQPTQETQAATNGHARNGDQFEDAEEKPEA